MPFVCCLLVGACVRACVHMYVYACVLCNMFLPSRQNRRVSFAVAMFVVAHLNSTRSVFARDIDSGTIVLTGPKFFFVLMKFQRGLIRLSFCLDIETEKERENEQIAVDIFK